jgi:hypothetical protein
MSFFRQQHAALDESANFLVSDVCRATGAMPLYFDPVIIESFSQKKVTENSFVGAIHRDRVDIPGLINALKEEKIIGPEGEILGEFIPGKWQDFKIPEKWKSFQKIIYAVLERIRNPSFTFVDGVIFANNPSACTLIEISNMHLDYLPMEASRVQNSIMISLGTGLEEVHEPYNGKVNPRFATKLMSMLFGCAESLSHYQTMLAYGAAAVSNQFYYLDPVISAQPGKKVPTSSFSDTRLDNIKALEDLAAAYAEIQRPQLQNIVNDLLANAGSG